MHSPKTNKKLTRHQLGIINEFSHLVNFKVNIQRLSVFLHSSKEHSFLCLPLYLCKYTLKEKGSPEIHTYGTLTKHQDNLIGKRTVLSTNDSGIVRYHHEKNIVGCLSHSRYKYQFGMGH